MEWKKRWTGDCRKEYENSRGASVEGVYTQREGRRAAGGVERGLCGKNICQSLFRPKADAG